MSAWTNVPKPTGTPYTNVNPQGKEQYDQASLIYDDPNTFYDGINMAAWTNIAKPTGIFNITAGMYMGPLGLTYSKAFTGSPWTKVIKPTT